MSRRLLALLAIPAPRDPSAPPTFPTPPSPAARRFGPSGEAALEQATRNRIYQFITGKPGCHVRDVERSLALPFGTVAYHLHYLERSELVTTVQDGGYRRYYPSRSMGVRDKELLAILRRKVPRRIAAFLLIKPGANYEDLKAEFGLSGSTLHYHLDNLIQRGVVVSQREGRVIRYQVATPDDVGRVLRTYRPTFFDDVVDRFIDVWSGFNP